MAGEELIVAGLIIVVLTMMLMSFTIARRYKKVAPDEAMVIYGRRRGERGYVVVTGGAKFIVPIVMAVRTMNIGAHLLRIHVADVMTRSGVSLTVDCVAIFKISSEQTKLHAAVGQWLSKSAADIENAALEVITAQVRGVCSTMEVEQINADRDGLSGAVRAAVTPHFANLGFDILSFALKDIADQVGYLEALGKTRTAGIKRDAIVAEATARKEAMALAAEQDVQGQKIRFKADAEIAAAQAERDAAIEGHKKDAALRTARAK